MEIKVAYGIWELAKSIREGIDYYIVWYYYIDWYWVQYVWIDQDWKELYLKGCELQNNKDIKIWFSIDK